MVIPRPSPSTRSRRNSSQSRRLRVFLLHTIVVLFVSAFTGCRCKAPLAKGFVPPAPLPVPTDSIVPTDSNSTGAPAAGRFSVNSDGAATYFYPIWTPAGRRGIQPTIAIVYNSTKENGALGVGWVLQGLSGITRCKRDVARDGFNAAIQFDQSDAFCLDGQRLVAFPGVDNGVTGPYGSAGTEYRTEDEQFSRIINGPTDDKGPLSFEVRLKDGRIFFYGETSDSRLEGQRFKSTPTSLAGTRINGDFKQTVRLTWSLSEVRDRFGNNLMVTYATTGDPANLQGYEQLPQAIQYTGTLDQSLAPRRSVNFTYEERPDTQTTFISGLRLQLRHRLSQINLSAPNPVETSLVKSYLLKYNVSSGTGRSLLSSVSECDANQICLVPSTFAYSLQVADGFTDVDTGIHDATATSQSTSPIYPSFSHLITGDVNGDGCDDLIYSTSDSQERNVYAGYALSACYDGISKGDNVFPSPSPPNLYQLAPQVAGAPDSGLPGVTFSPATLDGGIGSCTGSGEIMVNCYNQLTALDLDLDGRADLLAYFVAEDCDNPFPRGCDISTTWNQRFSTSVFLASSIPPAQWNPFAGLFGGETQNFFSISIGKNIFGTAPPNSFFYTSTYVGDINGDGFPDLVHLNLGSDNSGLVTWSFLLNNGRTLVPPVTQLKCGTAGNPCLNLDTGSSFFPGVAPFSGLTNVFMTDVFREGTTDLILRDPNGQNWYSAYRLSSRNCLPGVQFCPVLPPPNLALAAGDAYTPPRKDYFIDVTGDGLPDSVSIPGAGFPEGPPAADQHPYIAVNTGNGFDSPVQITQGALPRSISSMAFDYDGNGTADLIYTSVEQRPEFVAWLPVDMQGNGVTQIVQLWDNYSRLGMTVWAPNANDSYSQSWSSSDMGQGSAGRFLPVHMFGDRKTQIVQLWEDNSNHDHRLAMTVWGPNPDGRFSQLWGATMGQGAGALEMLPVDMQGDGRTEIAQLWNSHGNLGFIVWGPNPDGSYSQVCCTGDTGHILESKIIRWLPVDMHGDGKTEIVELWDYNNRLRMNIWVPNANYSYSLAWTSGDMGQGSGADAWVPIDMFGDGKTEIAQFWHKGNKLSIIVWGPNSNNSYTQIGGGDTNQDLARYSTYLPVHMPGRKNAITQLWDNNNELAINVWVPDANKSFSLGWQSNDMGQGSGALAWVAADLVRGNQTRIVQFWNSNPATNVHKLGMIVWVPHFDGSYSQAWGSSDMGSYLYALLTEDNGRYKSVPLLDQTGNPIRSGSNLPVWPLGSGSNLQVFDVNGDSLMDLVQILDGDIHVYLRNGIKRDLLTEVIDRGALISATYAPLSSHNAYTTTVPPGVVSSAGTPTPFSPGNTYVLNRGGWVVTSYSVPRAGSLGPSDPVNTYTFCYADGRVDLHGRGWLGFGRTIMTDQQTHAQTTTTYDNATMVGTAYPFAHRPHVSDTTVTLTDSGRINERVTTTTYKTSGQSDGSYIVVLPVDTLRQEFEGTSQASNDLIRSLDTTTDFDNFGNPTRILRKTGDGYTDTSTAAYQENPISWLIFAQTAAVDSSSTPTGAATTRTTEFVPDPNTGALLTEIVEPNGNEDTYRQTTYERDSHGIPTGIAGSDRSGRRSRVLRLGFDLEDLYPSYRANALGHLERFSVHPAFGFVALHEDINQVAEKHQYDGFGRLRSIIPADGAQLSVTYPSGSFPEVDVKRVDGYTLTTLSDAYMNAVERDWTGFDGQTTILLTSYNAEGLVNEQDGPCHYSGTPCSASGFEQYTYDERGRPIGVVHADRSSRRITHFNLKTTYFDELQNQRYTFQDQLGRLTKSVAISDSGAEIPVSYLYGPFNLFDDIVDPGGNIIHTAHDIRGRPATLDHPDRGNHSFKWNAFSELTEERDGNGRLTRYKRDPLGRITSIKDKDGLTDFCWDISPHGLGLIERARSSSGITTRYTYDVLSRPVIVSSRIAGKNYEIGTGFDSIGRVASITYPSTRPRPRFGILQVFNSYGYLKQIVDASTGTLFWQANKENERGQITDEVIGSGLETQRRFDKRGFLRTISTSAGGTAVQQLANSYFPTGSLQSRITQLQLSTIAENFKYDALDRLREWTASLAPNTTPSNSMPLLDQTFSYDDLGNLLQRAITFGPGQTRTYQYGQNHAGPHAATQVNSEAFGYDPGGNQISGPARKVRYTAFDLPAKLKNGQSNVAFEYDAMHQRALKRASNGDRTIYMNGRYEQRRHKGELTDIFYVPGSGHLIAQVEQPAGTSQKIRYFYHDHLSSVETVTDNNVPAITAEVGYEPLGTHVDPLNPALPSARGLGSVAKDFTEQTLDASLELLDMKGRIYDPKLGRFLTPDPVLRRSARSESLNPYSYALNNPLKWIDPSGFQDEAPLSGSADQSDDVNNCGAGCIQLTPQGGDAISVQATASAGNTVLTSTTDDNGTLSPPPLVNAPDIPGPDLSGGEWAPYPYDHPENPSRYETTVRATRELSPPPLIEAPEDFNFDTVRVIITRDFGVGDHAALWLRNRGSPILYDPNGSFLVGTQFDSPSRVFEGSQAKLSKYIGFQKGTGSEVETFEFSVSRADERMILERIDPSDGSNGIGTTGLFSCATDVSTALRGIGPFKELEGSWLPGRLADQLGRLPSTSVAAGGDLVGLFTRAFSGGIFSGGSSW